jgi:hypothetical protein
MSLALRPRSRRSVLTSLLLLAACSSSDPETTPPPDPPPPENQKPLWTDAPSAELLLGQGQSAALPITTGDPDGDAVTVRLEPPPGVEAELVDAEIRLHADYVVQGPQSLRVILTDALGAELVIDVAVTVRPIRWLGKQTWTDAEGPEAREHATMVLDAEGRQAFMIQGSGYDPQFVPLGDFWRYDLETAAWTEVTPTGDVPQPAGSRRVAQVPGTPVSYLFGGYLEAGNVNELYRVTVEGTGLRFQLIDQIDPPTARALHAFAYDPVTDRFVAFGGASTKPLDDTYVMTLSGDVATWTRIEPAVAPSPRYGFFYGFDAELGRLVVFSGAQGFASLNPAPDTWALDVRAEPPTWSLLTETGPIGRRNGTVVFDPTGPRLFVYGGTPDGATTTPGLFVFDARPGKSVWTELALPDPSVVARSSGFGFHDPATDTVRVGFGNGASIYRDWGSIGY